MAGMGTVRAIWKPVITQWMLVTSALIAPMIFGKATATANMLNASVICPVRMVRTNH
jgi:hypothetical protein